MLLQNAGKKVIYSFAHISVKLGGFDIASALRMQMLLFFPHYDLVSA